MNPMDYANYGVAIFAIACLAFIVERVLKMVSNHLQHNTQSNQELKDKIVETLEFLKDYIAGKK